MAAMRAYCVRCRSQQTLNNPREETTKNGKPIIKGECGECGGGVNIIGRSISDYKKFA